MKYKNNSKNITLNKKNQNFPDSYLKNNANRSLNIKAYNKMIAFNGCQDWCLKHY
jgi:hypothetical protein